MSTGERETGVAVVAIAILLVLLVSVGGYMAVRSGVQHTGVALSILQMQAWFAAESGLEWSIHEATSNQASHDVICGDPPPAVAPFTLTGGAANGFEVTISCDDSGGFQEGGVSFEVDIITATASKNDPGDIAYVSRTVEAVITTGEALP